MGNLISRLDKKTFYSPDGCWYWTGIVDHKGYGMIRFDGPKGFWKKAHRVSYEAYKGQIPEGLLVCHSCDNRRCINPDHLWLGTNKDNINDRDRKGRGADHSGENNSQAKITREQVEIIKSLSGKKTQSEIGAMFGIAQCSVSAIVRDKRWQ